MDIRWLADRSFFINAATGTLVMDPLPGSGPGPDLDTGSAVGTVARTNPMPIRGKIILRQRSDGRAVGLGLCRESANEVHVFGSIRGQCRMTD